MGNGIGKLCLCSAGAGAGDISGRLENNIVFLSRQYDKAIGNSICYVRPDPCRFPGDEFSDDDVTLITFRSVFSATVSANSSATPSISLDDSLQHSVALDSFASFESSGSFTSMMVPLQLQLQHQHDPRALEKGLCWGPMESVPSPWVRVSNGGSTEKGSEPVKKLRRSLSHSGYEFQNKHSKSSLKKVLSRAFLSTLSLRKSSILKKNNNANARLSCSTNLSGELRLHGVEGDNYLDDGCDMLMGCQNLQWAQGRAGEDRVHIVICENHGWVFVGIYDGFNGPDATDYLLNNLFCAVHDELKGLLCSHNSESMATILKSVKGNGVVDGCCSSSFDEENYPMANEKLNLDCESKRVEGMNWRNSNKEVRMMWECEGDSDKVELEKKMQVNLSLAPQAKSGTAFTHSNVLQALSEALRKTEDAFLKTSDEMITHNPVLAMMGSCVLVMVMKGEDVYLMNVGDSRAVLATQTGNSLQLTMEHSTHVKEEVYRIRREHPDDPSAVTKGRVKGYLSVTRAFGAGFLKQPKQNNAVLETFKVSYIGESPYITCSPSLHHHKLSSNDKFLIISSDGLCQYFTNEEAVAKVESFITMFPDKDPAQLLIEEALSRAAKKAGMEFNELLDIPLGERRLYHDDISIVIISLEGKIWRSLA